MHGQHGSLATWKAHADTQRLHGGEHGRGRTELCSHGVFNRFQSDQAHKVFVSKKVVRFHPVWAPVTGTHTNQLRNGGSWSSDLYYKQTSFFRLQVRHRTPYNGFHPPPDLAIIARRKITLRYTHQQAGSHLRRLYMPQFHTRAINIHL